MRALFLLIAILGLSPFVHAVAEADMLVAYDNAYSDSNGGDANTEVLALNAVAASNLINERSGTGARIRICGYHKTWWQAGRSTLGGYVGWMNNYSDGELNDVTAAADARGADLVAFICAPTSGETSAAVAQQPGRYAAYGPGNFWGNIVAHESGGHNYGIDHRAGRENPKTIMLHNYCGGGANGYYSNPNLWLNGVKLSGDGGCLGDALQGGDAAYWIGAAAQGVADRNARVTVSPNLGNVVRRWRLNQSTGSAPNGTTVTDDISGTALLTVQGNNASFSGEGITIPGGAAGSGQAYLQLPSGVTDGYTNITLEVWATPLSARNWARILDFNDGSTNNYLMLTSSNGTNLSNQRFESNNGGTYKTVNPNLPTVAGMPHHYAFVFYDNGGGGGTWLYYRDGDLNGWFDVAYNLSSFPDTNNWLGRSAYGADDLAHCEYAEVRLSNVAMNADEVLANYQLGPNHSATTVRLNAGDELGQTSFNAGTHWSDGLAPSGGKSYETYNFRLRTPADGTSRTFAGNSLTVSGGSITYKGNNSTTNFGNLNLRGNAEFIQAGSGTWTVAGNMNVGDEVSMIRAANGPITLATNLSGSGDLLCVNNTVALTGSNSGFTGRTIVGDGRFSSLSIDSETRLGSNPGTFTADQLEFNRGIFYTTNNLTIDDANRGLRIGTSAALFNVGPGSTLTLAVPVSSPSSGTTLQTTPLYPNPVSGLLIKQNSGTLAFTHPNNSATNEIVIEGGTLAVNGAGRINNGDHFMPITNNGTLSIATSGDQLLSGVISGNGPLQKSGAGTLTLTAANTFTGAVTVSGGTLYANPGNAATNRAFSYVSGITVNSGGTLRAGPNGLFGWDGSQTKPITVHAGGIATTDTSNTDVNVGTITLNGGTLTGNPSAAWGSWNFKRVAGAKILVTADSTVSAPNVGLGTGNSIDVSAGRTLTFSGTITDLANEGVCALVKNNGTGTLVLSGTNTYTGATALNSGTTLVNGSLGNTAVTVAGAATLGGTGSIAGATTINGTHAPGASAGTQTFGSTLAYGAASRLKWELTANSTSAGAFDKTTASGAVTITAGAAVDVVLNASGSGVALDNAFWTQPRSWTFLTGSGVTGSFTLGTVSNDPGSRPVSDHGTLALQQDATSVSLVFTPYTPAELWRLEHFGDIANIGNGADNQDPDKDFVENFLERAFGGDPNVAEHDLLPYIDPAEPVLSIVYRKAIAATDLTFTVQESDDLMVPWDPATGSSAVVGDDGTVQMIRFTRPKGADTKLFLRLEVTGE